MQLFLSPTLIYQLSILKYIIYRTTTTAKFTATSYVCSIDSYILFWNETEPSLKLSFHYGNRNPLSKVDATLNKKRPIYSETHLIWRAVVEPRI